jgi:hypothetical protein
MGGSDCDFGVGGGHFWQRGDSLDRRGVGGIERGRAGGVDPFFCDVPFAEKRSFLLSWGRLEDAIGNLESGVHTEESQN